MHPTSPARRTRRPSTWSSPRGSRAARSCGRQRPTAWRPRSRSRSSPNTPTGFAPSAASCSDTAFDDEFAHTPVATRTFSDSLEALEVPHLYEMYEGDHRNRMGEPLATKVLPWIDAQLEH